MSRSNGGFSVASQDHITVMGEEELGKRVSFLEHLRYRQDNRGRYDVGRDAEVEICYLQRELEIRQQRRAAHERYLCGERIFVK